MSEENAQTQYLSLILEHRDLADDFKESSLSPHHFDPIYRRLIHAIMDAYDKDVKLTRRSFIDFVTQLTSKKQEIAKQEVLFNKISFLSVDRNDYPMLKAKVFDRFIVKTSANYIRDFNEQRDKHGNVHAVKQLAANMQDLASSTDDKKKIVYDDINAFADEYIEWIDDVRNDRIEDTEFVSFGFEELDQTSAVGAASGTLTLFCGDTGGFKSTTMINVGLNIWLKGDKNVLFVPLEMPKKQIQHKILSRETRIPFENLAKPKSLSDDQVERVRKKLKEEWPQKKGRFFIMDCYEERAKVSVIRRQIQQNLEIFEPDVVIIDYIANLKPDNPRNDRPDIEVGEMLKELYHMGRKGVIHDNGFGVVSAAQIGREALRRVRKQPGDKMSFNSEDIRGAHDYSADSTAIYVLFPDPQQPGEALDVFCVKSRYGKKTFPDGSNKARLQVRPEISLIESATDYYTGDNAGDILQKIADDDEEDSFDFMPADDDGDEDSTENPIDVDESIDDIFDSFE